MEKIKAFFMKLNEHIFNIIALVIASLLTYISYAFELQSLQILSLLLLRVSLFLFIGSGFITFLNGVGCDIKKEIFVENNSAAAIMTAGFWIGLAIAISVTI